MQTKSIPHLVWLAPAVLLVIATAHLPYGYYTAVRIVTCGSAALIAFSESQDRHAAQTRAVALALVAVLYNPFIPIHLSRSTWLYLDLITAAIFIVHWFLVRQWASRREANIHRQSQ